MKKALITGITGQDGSYLAELLIEKGYDVKMYDPYVDSEIPVFEPSVFLIGTKHPDFIEFGFPEGSVIIDPWRYIPDKQGVKVVRVGE